MSASNRSLGNAFEQRFAQALSKEGFWVHLLTQDRAGQPADVMAVKNGHAYLIDCKVCSGERFPLSRIEENQWLAMGFWEFCGNGRGWFAMELSDGSVWMIEKSVLHNVQWRASLRVEEIRKMGMPLEEWIGMH